MIYQQIQKNSNMAIFRGTGLVYARRPEFGKIFVIWKKTQTPKHVHFEMYKNIFIELSFV